MSKSTLTSRLEPGTPRACRALFLFVVATVAGCSSSTSKNAATYSGSGANNGPLKVEGVSTSQVVVAEPLAQEKHGVLSITGSVHRAPGFTGPLAGRVDIDLIGPGGMMLDTPIHCPLRPAQIAMSGDTTSSFVTHFVYIPPPGSTLRARFVTTDDARREDMEEGSLDVNGNGGHTGVGVHATQINGSMPSASGGSAQ